MAVVSITINGHSYTIGCENGEERHVQAMAHQVEQRIQRVRALGFNDDSRILVLAALLMADEIQDLIDGKEADSTKQATLEVERLRAEQALNHYRLTELAKRIEALATDIEHIYTQKEERPDT